MPRTTKSDARLNFRLPAELKQTIEEAAALTGQTVSDFAISVLVVNSRRVVEEHDQTLLSNRDREKFMALLDQTNAKPNKDLLAAARQYKKKVG